MSYPELEQDYQRLPENSRSGVSSTEAKNMYQKISASDLPMVFGNHAFQPGSQAIGIDHEMVRNFGTAAPSIKTVTDRVGGVLHEILPSGTILGSRQTGRGPSEKWSIAANDTWIIAGIRNSKDFYLASPLIEQTFINPANRDHPVRVTARELCGLLFFGYRAVPGETGAFAGFITQDGRRARQADLLTYGQFMEGKSYQQVLRYFRDHGINPSAGQLSATL